MTEPPKLFDIQIGPGNTPIFVIIPQGSGSATTIAMSWAQLKFIEGRAAYLRQVMEVPAM